MAGGAIVTNGGDKEYSGKLTLSVFMACLVTSSRGLVFGYSIGISGGVTSMDSFLSKFFPSIYEKSKVAADDNQYYKFDNTLLAMFTSLLYLAALTASFCASSVTRVFGRKWSRFGGGINFLTSSAFNGAAQNVFMLIIVRLLLGVGVIFTNQSVPLYLSEIATAWLRAMLNIGFQLMITIGVLTSDLIIYSVSKIEGAEGLNSRERKHRTSHRGDSVLENLRRNQAPGTGTELCGILRPQWVDCCGGRGRNLQLRSPNLR